MNALRVYHALYMRKANRVIEIQFLRQENNMTMLMFEIDKRRIVLANLLDSQAQTIADQLATQL